MNDKNVADLWIGVAASIAAFIGFIFLDPFLLWIIIPTLIFSTIVYGSGTTHRDEYFKSKKNLIATVFVVGFMTLATYYFMDSDFVFFPYNQNFYVFLAGNFVAVALFLNWFTKKAVPISSVDDDDRLVQETMYPDYGFQSLGDTYLYRYAKYKDEKSKDVLKPQDIFSSEGVLTPKELNVYDVEMEAINDDNELKFYYEKVLFDMYNDLLQGGKKQERMLEQYGYCFTVVDGIKSHEHFKEVLKEHSLLYYKIFCFLEADMKKSYIGIKLRWKNIYADNLHCLEFCLISVILMVRQYMNFPVGDMAKYVRTTKDKNFLGCFSSLPAELGNVDSTSVSASGIAYYYVYHKLHLEFFRRDVAAVEERWLS